MGKISTIKQRGFTLIEMCIVILIIGILTVAFIQSYEIYNEKRLMELTDLKFNDINQAMERYAERNGRLPCPGPRLVGGADRSMYGEEVCGGIDSGVITVNNAAGTPVAFIGMLPAVELGLSSDYLKDGYNRSLIYAVSIDLTEENPATQTGALQLEERTLIYDEAAGVTEEVVKMYDEVQYVVVSAGRRSDGGFSVTGNRIGDCNADNGLDFENCNDDLLFVAAYRSDAETTQSFDDRVAFKESIPLMPEAEPTSCEQKYVQKVRGTTCPTGWEPGPNIGTVSAPVSGGGGGFSLLGALFAQGSYATAGSQAAPSQYYNVDPDTGEFYFTDFQTPNTVSEGDESKSILCSKRDDNPAVNKCFNHTVNAPVASKSFTSLGGVSSYSFAGQTSHDNLANKCPEGYKPIDYEIINGGSSEATDNGWVSSSFYLHAVCGK